MSTTPIAQDVPRDIITLFERVDWPSVTYISEQALMLQLKAFCATLPTKTSDYYTNTSTSIIPQDVVYTINGVDFTRLEPRRLTEILTWLNKNLPTMLPMRKAS
jgi:hypothetical protein